MSPRAHLILRTVALLAILVASILPSRHEAERIASGLSRSRFAASAGIAHNP